MNWLDILVVIVAVYSLLKGYKSGFIKQLASLIGVIACILLSGKVSSILLPYLQNKLSGNWIEPVAFVASFLLIFAIAMVLGYMIQSIIETAKMGTLNKLAGAALSLGKWMIVISLVLNVFVKMDEKHLLIPEDIDDHSRLYRYIYPIAPALTPYLKFDLQ